MIVAQDRALSMRRRFLSGRRLSILRDGKNRNERWKINSAAK
jgi:hypothetical protein